MTHASHVDNDSILCLSACGSALNLGRLVTAGAPGVILGVCCSVLTGFAGYFTMKLTRSKYPQVGAAIGTTAGNAVATPMALAAADSTFVGAIANSATVQIAAAIIVTAILCPIIVSFCDKIEKRKQELVIVESY